MKLALGTVQFGLNYGIANDQGKVQYNQATSILQLASKKGISTLDTAIAYGNSEEVLGSIGVDRWDVISKLPAIPSGCVHVADWVYEQVSHSLKKLNIPCLEGLLLHKPQDLLGDHGDTLYRELQKLKVQGKVKKIGISIYTPSELEAIFHQYDLDIVQSPLNIVDRRLIHTGWLQRLREASVEVHTRSAFLQGLLLMSNTNRPERFNKWKFLWQRWDAYLADNKLTPLHACLQYVSSFNDIEKIIVGVNNVHQLEQITSAYEKPILSFPEYLHYDDADLINPMYWDSL